MARLGPEGDPARPQEHGQRQTLPGQQRELEQYLGDPAAADDAEGGRGHHAEEAAETQRRQGSDDALMAAPAPVEGRIGLVGAVAGSGGGLVDGVVDVGGAWHGVGSFVVGRLGRYLVENCSRFSVWGWPSSAALSQNCGMKVIVPFSSELF